MQPPTLRLRTLSPALARTRQAAVPIGDRSIQRRLGWTWGLLLFNVLGHEGPSILPISSTVGKLLTEGALALALVLALSLNRRLIVRPTMFLALLSVLCLTTMAMSIDGYGVGSVFRASRLIVFVAMMWLITPWWGRSDFLLTRIHRNVLIIVLTSVIIGMLVAPGRAFAQAGGGRLGGTLWPIPPTQVAHYAAVVTGLTVVMWLSRMISSRSAMLVGFGGLAVLLLTHTRTALVGLLVGILVAGLSMFLRRKRVRRAFAVAIVVVLIGALSFAPFFGHWFARGENVNVISGLNGRSTVWNQLLAQPRTAVHTLFGFGISNNSFDGFPIDSSWLSTYLDQGLVGDILIGAALLAVMIKALLSPNGPGRAIALFIVSYCLIASFTETGLGGASSYLLDLSIAMSVLMAPLTPVAAVLEE